MDDYGAGRGLHTRGVGHFEVVAVEVWTGGWFQVLAEASRYTLGDVFMMPWRNSQAVVFI